MPGSNSPISQDTDYQEVRVHAGAPVQGAGPGLSHLQASSKTSSLLTQKPMALLDPSCYNEVLP